MNTLSAEEEKGSAEGCLGEFGFIRDKEGGGDPGIRRAYLVKLSFLQAKPSCDCSWCDIAGC